MQNTTKHPKNLSFLLTIRYEGSLALDIIQNCNAYSSLLLGSYNILVIHEFEFASVKMSLFQAKIKILKVSKCIM